MNRRCRYVHDPSCPAVTPPCRRTRAGLVVGPRDLHVCEGSYRLVPVAPDRLQNPQICPADQTLESQTYRSLRRMENHVRYVTFIWLDLNDWAPAMLDKAWWISSGSCWAETPRLSPNTGICIMEQEEICFPVCGDSAYEGEHTVWAWLGKPEECRDTHTHAKSVLDPKAVL